MQYTQWFFVVYPQLRQSVNDTCPQVVVPVQKLSISCESTKIMSFFLSTEKNIRRALRSEVKINRSFR
jgi:hypothetical protein